jgi:pilus assembly protein CpaD
MSRLYVLALVAASLTAGACSHTKEDLRTATGERTHIRPVQVTAELRLTPEGGGDRLDLQTRDAVRQFAAAYREEGDGPLVISRPRSGEEEAPGMRIAGEIRGLLLAEGVDPSSIREGAYDAAGAAVSPTVLQYSAWEAHVTDCPTIGSQDLIDVRSNTVLPSFGCAVASNLAVMIADPRDLVGEQPLGEGDAGRRSIVFAKYRAGEPTAATPNPNGKVTISGAVGN